MLQNDIVLGILLLNANIGSQSEVLAFTPKLSNKYDKMSLLFLYK